jgi:hypothetical protein
MSVGMGGGIGIVGSGERGARALAAHSRAALDRPLTHAGELWTAVASDEAILLGAFQRRPSSASGVPGRTDPGPLLASPPRAPPGDTSPDLALFRRGSGGPAVRLGPGTVHVALALAHPGALVACDEKRIVNRYVRPLLRALTRVGALAHFFGRDWVSVHHRPAAWVGFAHDATTRRTFFEAFVAVDTPVHVGSRTSFLGKTPGTLAEILGKRVEPERVADAIVEAYVAAFGVGAVELEALPDDVEDDDAPRDPPWAATTEEAIGTLGAGPDARGVFRVGGDLLVSRDALARLEARLPSTANDALAALVDETLAAPGVALDGVRSLASVLRVIEAARGR